MRYPCTTLSARSGAYGWMQMGDYFPHQQNVTKADQKRACINILYTASEARERGGGDANSLARCSSGGGGGGAKRGVGQAEASSGKEGVSGSAGLATIRSIVELIVDGERQQ